MSPAQQRRLPEPGTVSVLLFAAVHALWSTRSHWNIHRGLGTSAYDVGLYDQGVWLLSRFKSPFVTLMGRNMLGDHASLILFLVVPLYWVVPGTETLLALQSALIAAGALPVYFCARRLLSSQSAALVFAVAWLVNPAVNGANFENFHPDSFLALLVPLALWALLTRRFRWYTVSVVLSALVKEDVSLVLVPLGLLAVVRGEGRRGILTIVGAVAASLAGMFLLMRNLIGVPTRNGWRIPFGGVKGFLRETVTNPSNVLRYLGSEGRLFYLWQMTAPFAFVFMLAPEVAAVSALVIVGNIVSTFWYQFHIGYHYSLVAVPALVFATVVGVSRIHRDTRPVAVSIVLLASVVSGVMWTALPFGLQRFDGWTADSAVAREGRAIIAQVPRGVPVSVFHALAPHLAHREEIYQFPNPFRTVLYGNDEKKEGTRNPAADRIQYVVIPLSLDPQGTADFLAIVPEFEPWRKNGSWAIWKRRASPTAAPSGAP